MPVKKINRRLAEEKRVREMGAAADRIAALFEEYGITAEEIEVALKAGAQSALAKMYPELAKEAEAVRPKLAKAKGK